MAQQAKLSVKMDLTKSNNNEKGPIAGHIHMHK